MDVKQQEYFVAIVEEGSISKAAKKLYISQPTLSQFLSKLESSMETKLVTRSSNNTLSLTASGQLFYESCKKVLMIRDDFEAKFAEMNDSATASLIIGNNMGVSMNLLLELISSLSATYPNVKVSFRHGKPYKLHEMLAAGEIDIGFSAYREKNPKFEYIDFPPMEMAIILHKDHPLYHLGAPDMRCDMPHMDLKCFENETFVQLYPGTVMRDILDDYCLEHNIKLNISTETYGSNFALKAVESGLGISIYPPDSTAKSEKLRYIGLNPPLHQKWGLYYSKSAYQTAYFRDLIKSIRHLSKRDEPFISE